MFISTKINCSHEFYYSHFPRINRKIDNYFFYTKSPKIVLLKFHISFWFFSAHFLRCSVCVCVCVNSLVSYPFICFSSTMETTSSYLLDFYAKQAEMRSDQAPGEKPSWALGFWHCAAEERGEQTQRCGSETRRGTHWAGTPRSGLRHLPRAARPGRWASHVPLRNGTPASATWEVSSGRMWSHWRRSAFPFWLCGG